MTGSWGSDRIPWTSAFHRILNDLGNKFWVIIFLVDFLVEYVFLAINLQATIGQGIEVSIEYWNHLTCEERFIYAGA